MNQETIMKTLMSLTLIVASVFIASCMVDQDIGSGSGSGNHPLPDNQVQLQSSPSSFTLSHTDPDKSYQMISDGIMVKYKSTMRCDGKVARSETYVDTLNIVKHGELIHLFGYGPEDDCTIYKGSGHDLEDGQWEELGGGKPDAIGTTCLSEIEPTELKLPEGTTRVKTYAFSEGRITESIQVENLCLMDVELDELKKAMKDSESHDKGNITIVNCQTAEIELNNGKTYQVVLKSVRYDSRTYEVRTQDRSCSYVRKKEVLTDEICDLIPIGAERSGSRYYEKDLEFQSCSKALRLGDNFFPLIYE